MNAEDKSLRITENLDVKREHSCRDLSDTAPAPLLDSPILPIQEVKSEGFRKLIISLLLLAAGSEIAGD
ncbi:hypothetical protein L1987_06084 [Smallanthus sonchifolius]|uniref:Uncharacterized protein n=1 Tax=Smallanthus sonchifolius TaxID=185202 RepID=A0ACB9JXB6_9ASTR|nr:hypothetical protein L1987_06084 [Smallanthus sonchifolius]